MHSDWQCTASNANASLVAGWEGDNNATCRGTDMYMCGVALGNALYMTVAVAALGAAFFAVCALLWSGIAPRAEHGRARAAAGRRLGRSRMTDPPDAEGGCAAQQQLPIARA